MATLAGLTDATYDLLYGPAQVTRPKEDTLTSTVDNAVVELQWDTEAMWKRDDWAESATDGEIVVLAEDHPTAATCTVRRAQPRGQTAAAAHTAGDVFYRNNPHPRYLVERLINEVVDNELYPHVWTRNNRTLSGGWIPDQTLYDLAANDIEVEQMYQADVGGDLRFHPLPPGWWEVVGSVVTGVASTGNLLRIFRVSNPDEPVYYTVRTRPTSGDLASLSTQIENMIPWAVVGKLMQATVAPTRSAPSRARPAVTQSGDRQLRDATFFRAEFERMRGDEKRRLQIELMKEQQYKRRRRRVG